MVSFTTRSTAPDSTTRIAGCRLKGLARFASPTDNELEKLLGVSVFFKLMDTPDGNVTAILRAAQLGDQEAAARLLPLVYDELRKLAQARMANLPPGQTMQPTALVHEVYLRLVGMGDVPLEGRRHFFFVAARAMRDILVEQARRKAGPRKGGDRHRVEMREQATEPVPEEVLAVHEALAQLEQEDPLKAQIVNLRYFTGMTVAETAHVLGISERTLHRHWPFIKAWLKSRLRGPEDPA
jgi:RNA polymerase sigma factor (TIGR02999 family)